MISKGGVLLQLKQTFIKEISAEGVIETDYAQTQINKRKGSMKWQELQQDN